MQFGLTELQIQYKSVHPTIHLFSSQKIRKSGCTHEVLKIYISSSTIRRHRLSHTHKRMCHSCNSDVSQPSSNAAQASSDLKSQTPGEESLVDLNICVLY